MIHTGDIMETDRKQQSQEAEMVEVVDREGKPLAVLSATEAHRQSLPHRAVLALLFEQGCRLALTRRSLSEALYPGRWELPARGHIRPGEAASDAARRLAELRFPQGLGPLTPHASLKAGEDTGFEALKVFRCPLHSDGDDEDLLLVSREELSALADEHRELFAPWVVFALKEGVLFPEKSREAEPQRD